MLLLHLLAAADLAQPVLPVPPALLAPADLAQSALLVLPALLVLLAPLAPAVLVAHNVMSEDRGHQPEA